MGAAVSVEATKPQDASDVRATGDLEYAKSEVVRLRNELGHLAKLAGVTDAIVLDASDIVLGQNKDEDFGRCCDELAHIRSLLRLHTQNNKRKARSYQSVFNIEQLEQLGAVGVDFNSTTTSSNNNSTSSSNNNDSTSNGNSAGPDGQPSATDDASESSDSD
jgi:hypothetical protein